MTVIQITRDLLRTMPLPTPDGGSKDERGRVLVVAGSREVPGAALLSGVAALRAGAGKLRIASGASVAVPLALAAPEALVMGLPETESGGLAVAGQKRLLACVPSSDGVLVGPGMTDEPATGELTAKMLQQAGDAGFVLDAAAAFGCAACRRDGAVARSKPGDGGGRPDGRSLDGCTTI
jgi:ADP-dependent NAD(P)H-hydrate dehydratase